MYCTECLRSDEHHPNCPNAEDAVEETYTFWMLGEQPDITFTGEEKIRLLALVWKFDPDALFRDEEVDIVKNGIVIGGMYKGEVS